MHRQPRLLFGTSAAITKVLDQCARFARTRDPILLLGERGTGKSALAEHIHELSRRPGELVEESAAGLPRDMEVARLAGHVRGAFTDARESRPGLLELAHGGTFFLDEVSWRRRSSRASCCGCSRGPASAGWGTKGWG